MDNNKKTGAFRSDAFKLGGSQTLLIAIAVVVAVLINLIAAGLPATVTEFDLSRNGFFTLSEQSVQVCRNLTEPITLYLVAENGAENDTITTLLDRYAAAGSNITVQYVDPVLYPGFTTKYTSETVSANSVIVESPERFKIVDNTQIFVQDYTNYNTTGQVSSSFDGEGAITSAIAYVTSDELPTVYVLGGHGEAQLSDSLRGMILKDNYTLGAVNLMTEDALPERCDALILLSPQSDLSERELTILSDYLENGGSMVVLADILPTATPNLDRLLASYGLQLERGMVIERSGDNFLAGGYYHYLLPVLGEHEITAPLRSAGQYALMPMAQAVVETASHRSTLSITPLLYTTQQSYLKQDVENMTTAEKETGDPDGPFMVGAAVTEETPGGTTHLVVYTTSDMLQDSVDSVVYGGNSNLFLSTLGWMCQYDAGMSIHAKPVDQEVLVVPASASNLWSLILVVVLPLAVLAVGAIVTLMRRKK